MDHYIAYHSIAVMKRDYSSPDRLYFQTNKAETTVRGALGATVWVIVGRQISSRTQFRLAGAYLPDELAREGDKWIIDGPGTTLNPAPEVTSLPWFKVLMREQGNFSHGFNRIKSQEVIDALTALVQPAAAPTTGADRARALREEGESVVEPFNPRDEKDARLHVLASLVRRQGQAAFRRELFRTYGGKCAITGWAVADVLEAAHIVPYRGKHTNHVTNGILLRSDLHVLFDLHLLEINPETYSVRIDPTLHDTPYQEMHGRKLLLPADARLWPSPECLLLRARRGSL
jgi:HNH endonuclease